MESAARSSEPADADVASAARSSEPADAVLERVFAVTSVFPLVAFSVLHVFDYARVLVGVDEIGSRRVLPPWLLVVEVLLIWLPLVFHVAFGIRLWLRRRLTPEASPSARALVGAHRLASVFVAAFLLDHVLRFRFPIWRGELAPADSVQHLAAELSKTQSGIPWVAALQLFGTLALAFHVGYGLRRIALRTPAFAGNRWSRGGAWAVAVILFGVGVLTLLYLSAG